MRDGIINQPGWSRQFRRAGRNTGQEWSHWHKREQAGTKGRGGAYKTRSLMSGAHHDRADGAINQLAQVCGGRAVLGMAGIMAGDQSGFRNGG